MVFKLLLLTIIPLVTHLLSLLTCTPYTSATTIDVRNNCPFVLWPAAIPQGGHRLDPGEKWVINFSGSSNVSGRVWARTNCKFDAAGRGRCQTGDCGGVLECTSGGQPPVTLAEFTINQANNLDFFDLSLTDGFNVPMEFRPVTTSSGGACSKIKLACTDDLNGKCPDRLQGPGGCYNACGAFGIEEYCCKSADNCSQTIYSRFFKDRCPDAYSYPFDDATSTFSCPGSTNYIVIFCP